MFPYILGGVAVIVGLYLIARWWSQATPHQLAVALRWAALALGVGVIVFATLTRRWGLLAALAAPALMVWRSVRAARTHRRNARGPAAGRQSTVETRFLRMTLDHDSGAMTGEVVAGEFAGRSLDALTLGEAIALWRTCVVEDEPSRGVLEAWLDRVHGDAWRQAAGGAANDASGRRDGSGKPGAPGEMSVDEARDVLGVDATADRAAIETAYRQAMLRGHPDHGGSDAEAARINRARDVLLGR